jgi:hypothetical protein
MKTTIGIFQGKEAKNNKFLLETLYENGPLTAWELTKKVRAKNRYSLHAIFNKRLRDLEKKGYVQKVGRKWVLQFKGILAVLMSQSKPKPWSETWNQILENYLKNVKNIPKYAITENGKEIINLTEYIRNIINSLRDFESWVLLANRVKELMDRGIINFDLIDNDTLFRFSISEFAKGVYYES